MEEPPEKRQLSSLYKQAAQYEQTVSALSTVQVYMDNRGFLKIEK